MIALMLVLVLISQRSCGDVLPSFIHVCQRSDPEIETCIIQTMEEIRPHLVTDEYFFEPRILFYYTIQAPSSISLSGRRYPILPTAAATNLLDGFSPSAFALQTEESQKTQFEGEPEYNIPSVEPLFIKELIREQSSGLTLTTSDVVAYGGGNFNVMSCNIDFDSLKFTTDVELPDLKVQAKYSVEGRVMVLQVKGRGSFYGNMTNCTGHAVFQGELYEKDGNEHLRFVSSSMKVNIGNGRVRVETGRGNMLNKLINDALNRNLKGFLRELMPFIEKALAAKFLEIANNIVEPFTYEQLFPK